MSDPTFDLPCNKNTIGSKFSYYLDRILSRTKTKERFSDHFDSHMNGDIYYNRNLPLLMSIPIWVTAGLTWLSSYYIGQSAVITAIFIAFISVPLTVMYGISVLTSLGIALSEYIHNPPEEREYVRDLIDK